jgi:hypothetical protein
MAFVSLPRSVATSPPPEPQQTPFQSFMQLAKILAVVIPTFSAMWFLFDRAAAVIQMFDGVTNHLSTLDNSVNSLNNAEASLATTVGAQASEMATHTAQLTAQSDTLKTQSDTLQRIENALTRWGGPAPEHQAYVSPPGYVPPVPQLPTPLNERYNRHPCLNVKDPHQHC